MTALRVRGAAILVLLVAVTGCGSTVRPTADAPVADAMAAPGSSAGAGSPSTTTAPGAVGQPGGSPVIGASGSPAGGTSTTAANGSGTTGTRPQSTTPSPAAPSGTSAAGQSGATPPQPSGPTAAAPGTPAPGAPAATGQRPMAGVTDTTVSVGYYTADDADAAFGAMGIEASFGDLRAQAQALAEAVNAGGGVLGRELLFEYYDISSASMTSDPNSAKQAACTHFTQDLPVAAVVSLSSSLTDDSFLTCMADGGVPVLSGYLGSMHQELSARHVPYFYGFGISQMERTIGARLDGLIANDFFEPWDTTTGEAAAAGVGDAVIGSIAVQAERMEPYLDVLASEMATRGLELSETFLLEGSTEQQLSQIPNALLRMRAAGVTHILPWTAVLLFAPQAESQGYRPRWAVTSSDTPGTLLQGSVPEAQLNGMIGLGWAPLTDVDAARYPGDTPAGTRCRQIMEDAGQDTSSSLTFAAMGFACDIVFAFDSSIEAAGGFDADLLAQGAEAVGEASSAITFSQRFAASQDRWLGPGIGRDMAYDRECACFLFLDTPSRGI